MIKTSTLKFNGACFLGVLEAFNITIVIRFLEEKNSTHQGGGKE
jgi:hypothetical protein